MADFITNYDKVEKLWKGMEKPKLCNENISAGKIALDMLRSKNPQDVMQISDSEHTTMTYGSALNMAIKIAKYFNSISLTGDDVVGIFSPDTTYVMPVALACWFNGTPFQAINCILETAVIQNLYDFSRPKIIFCDGLHYEKVKAACVNFQPLIYTLSNHLENVAKVEDLLQSTSMNEELYQAQPLKYGSNQTMAILVSSGTSGMPKGVCVPNRMCVTDFSFTHANTKMFSTSSIDWSSGLLTFMANILVGGTRIITTQPFTPEYLLEIIQKYKINFLSTSPANLLLTSLLKSYSQENMQSINLIFTAGSYCSDINLEHMRSVLTQGLLFYGYGGTETGGVSGRLNANKSKSVGRLLPNVQLKIVEVESGQRLGPGEIGEICVSQGYEWCGYYNNAKATAEILDSEGFIRTGDLGYMDEDNFLFLVGRCKDVMKFFGFQYSPQDIEEIIAELPDVVDVCVFGVYNEIQQDASAAAVVKREGSTLTAEQIMKYVEGKTEAPHKRIHYGVFFVKELLRNHNGKLLREKIKAMCLEMENNRKCLS